MIDSAWLKRSNYFSKMMAPFSQVQQQSSEGHNLLNHQFRSVFTEIDGRKSTTAIELKRDKASRTSFDVARGRGGVALRNFNS